MAQAAGAGDIDGHEEAVGEGTGAGARCSLAISSRRAWISAATAAGMKSEAERPDACPDVGGGKELDGGCNSEESAVNATGRVGWGAESKTGTGGLGTKGARVVRNCAPVGARSPVAGGAEDGGGAEAGPVSLEKSSGVSKLSDVPC